MENKNNRNSRYFLLFVMAIILIVIYKAVDSIAFIYNGIAHFLDSISPFMMAILFSYILYIPEKKIEKKIEKINNKLIMKHSRGISVFITIVLVILFVVLMWNLLYDKVLESVVELAKNVPKYLEDANKYLLSLDENHILRKANLTALIENVKSLDFLTNFINDMQVENIFDYLNSVINTTGKIFNAFVTIVLIIYILLERTNIVKFFKRALKAILDEKKYKIAQKYYHDTNDIFCKYITGQLLDALIIGIILLIVLNIMRVKYAFLIALIIGLFNVIPYFGAIFGIIFAIILTALSGGFAQAFWLAIVVIVIQQVDANVINPRILGGSLEVSPILVILAVTIGGKYFGVAGMFLGVPIIALLKVMVVDYIESKEEIKSVGE